LLYCFSFVYRFDLLEKDRDYWHDEAFQNIYSSKEVGFILDSNDVHPPLFNLIAKFWLWINDSIFFSRLLSIIFFTAFLNTLFFFTQKYFGEITALISCFLFAILPTWIYYSLEFRSYMFIFMLIPLQMHYFIGIVKFKPRSYTFYSIFSILLIYSHYFTAFLIFSQIIFIIINKRKDLKELSIPYTIIFIYCLPLLMYFVQTLKKTDSFWFTDVNLYTLISTFSYMLSFPNKYSILLFSFFVCCFFTLFYIYYGSIRTRGLLFKHKILLYQFLIPIGCLFIISLMTPIYHHRYFLFGGISIIILFADLLSKSMKIKESLEVVGSFIIIILFIISFLSYINMSNNLDYELRDSSNFISKVVDDRYNYTLIHSTTFSYTPFTVYLRDYDNIKNVLCTNLTERQLFTFGGSAVRHYDSIENCTKKYQDNVYFIDDKQIGEVVVWQRDGLIVSRKEMRGEVKQIK